MFPSDLPEVASRGLLLAVVLVLVARPLALLAVLPWFRLGHGATALVGWVGLRGAVPIVLATFPLTAGHPEAHLVFDVVFFVVFVSVAVQGTTIPRWRVASGWTPTTDRRRRSSPASTTSPPTWSR